MFDSIFGSIGSDQPILRAGILLAVALAAHLLVRLIQWSSSRIRKGRIAARWDKVATVLTLVTSALTFAIWFTAFGLIIRELGFDVSTYFASASVIALAVGFGSQGVVQDVVTGVTLVFSDLVDVGDMVEVSGQTGIVSTVGMRFLVLTNYLGARVYIPNRTINNVVNYQRGYVRALIDVRLPPTEPLATEMAERSTALVNAAWEQLPGLCVQPPSLVGRRTLESGAEFVRMKMRIWPGQTDPLQKLVLEMVGELGLLQPGFQAWRISLTYESEEKHDLVHFPPRPSKRA